MVSDFIVNHPKLPLFVLTKDEYAEAVEKEPSLSVPTKIPFLERFIIFRIFSIKLKIPNKQEIFL